MANEVISFLSGAFSQFFTSALDIEGVKRHYFEKYERISLRWTAIKEADYPTYRDAVKTIDDILDQTVPKSFFFIARIYALKATLFIYKSYFSAFDQINADMEKEDIGAILKIWSWVFRISTLIIFLVLLQKTDVIYCTKFLQIYSHSMIAATVIASYGVLFVYMQFPGLLRQEIRRKQKAYFFWDVFWIYVVTLILSFKGINGLELALPPLPFPALGKIDTVSIYAVLAIFIEALLIVGYTSCNASLTKYLIDKIELAIPRQVFRLQKMSERYTIPKSRIPNVLMESFLEKQIVFLKDINYELALIEDIPIVENVQCEVLPDVIFEPMTRPSREFYIAREVAYFKDAIGIITTLLWMIVGTTVLVTTTIFIVNNYASIQTYKGFLDIARTGIHFPNAFGWFFIVCSGLLLLYYATLKKYMDYTRINQTSLLSKS